MNDAFDLLTNDNFQKNENKNQQFGKDAFDAVQPEFKESRAKSIARWLYQVPSGIGQAITYPLDLLQLIGSGEALDPEEIDQIRKISEREGVPFDEEKYLQSVEEAYSMFPTQSNIERMIEEKTGAPLTPKTKGQKLLKLASTAGKFTKGNLGQKIAGGGLAAGTSAGLQGVGVPEPLSDLAGLGVGSAIGPKSPAIGISAKTKPSGLPVRRFEKVKEPRGVSSSKLGQIHEKLESDFKKISDKIISESPAGITKAKLADNPSFKQEVTQQFKDVENLAESLPERFHTKEVGNKIVENISKKKGTGFAPSEYDKDYRKFIQQFLKETPAQEIGASDLVAQYRKNNKSIGEAYDPTRPYAYNRAKKDALLDYNRAISDLIEDKFPNSEFSDLFRNTNKKWAEIADAEAIDKFIDAMFDPTKSGVQFGKGKRFFENENYARPFKRALGEEGFKQFDQLMKDMLSTEKAAKMLKVAKQKGWQDLAETAGAFIVHPTLGKVKLGFQAAKSAYKGLINSLLDKPQIGITWERGVKNLKEGKFSEAERDFNFLKKEAEKSETKTDAKIAKRPDEISSPERKQIEFKEPQKSAEKKKIIIEKSAKQKKNPDEKYKKIERKIIKLKDELDNLISRVPSPQIGRIATYEREIENLQEKLPKDHPLKKPIESYLRTPEEIKLYLGEQIPNEIPRVKQGVLEYETPQGEIIRENSEIYQDLFALTKTNSGYKISHIPTGKKIANFKTKQKAKKLLKNIFEGRLIRKNKAYFENVSPNELFTDIDKIQSIIHNLQKKNQ